MADPSTQTPGRIELTAVPQATRSSLVEPRIPAANYLAYKTLVQRATGVFGDPVIASCWLSTHNEDLGGRTPLALAQGTGYSLVDLEPLFTRIEHGIDF